MSRCGSGTKPSSKHRRSTMHYCVRLRIMRLLQSLFRVGAILLCLVLLVGCSSLPLTPPTLPSMPEELARKPKPLPPLPATLQEQTKERFSIGQSSAANSTVKP